MNILPSVKKWANKNGKSAESSQRVLDLEVVIPDLVEIDLEDGHEQFLSTLHFLLNKWKHRIRNSKGAKS